jgi:hypothetical protein
MAFEDYASRILADAASGFCNCRPKITRVVAEHFMAGHRQELYDCAIRRRKLDKPLEYKKKF